MKRALIIGGIFLAAGFVITFVVYKVRNTVTENDKYTNRRKWKLNRKIIIKKAKFPKTKIV